MQDLPIILLMIASLSGPAALAAEAKVDITSPENFAKLDAGIQNKIDYDVTLGGKGDHIHVYVDGKQTALLRKMKGSFLLDPLTQDKHEICIKIVNKNHTPIGVERCVKVVAQ